MLTVMILVSVSAFVTAILAVMGKCPLWVSVILLCLWTLLQSLPRG